MSGGVRNVLIGGGTGGIGGYLVRHLKDQGYNVSLITRSPKALKTAKTILDFLPNISKSGKDFLQDIRTHSWEDIQLNGIPHSTDAVINLSGRTIASPGFFSSQFKEDLRKSRIETTEAIAKAIQKSENPPKVFMAASAVGVYENREDMTYTEDTDPCRPDHHNFFTELCRDWEAASELPADIPTRVANMRLGVVLAPGTLPMASFLRMTVLNQLGDVGSGTQPFPWIHISDVIRSIEYLLTEDIHGPVNFVAPQIITNSELTQAIVDVTLSKKGPSLPPLLVEMIMGKERALSLMLDSPKVLPKKLLDHGFDFKAPEIRSAVKLIVDEVSNPESIDYSALLEKVIAKRKNT